MARYTVIGSLGNTQCLYGPEISVTPNVQEMTAADGRTCVLQQVSREASIDEDTKEHCRSATRPRDWLLASLSRSQCDALWQVRRNAITRVDLRVTEGQTSSGSVTH